MASMQVDRTVLADTFPIPLEMPRIWNWSKLRTAFQIEMDVPCSLPCENLFRSHTTQEWDCLFESHVLLPPSDQIHTCIPSSPEKHCWWNESYLDIFTQKDYSRILKSIHNSTYDFASRMWYLTFLTAVPVTGIQEPGRTMRNIAVYCTYLMAECVCIDYFFRLAWHTI